MKIITEVDVPELQLLASNLKPEECVKLVSLGSNSPLSETQIQKLARDQNCFRRLVKWICQLRTVTRNTYPILNDHLKRIGRRDLVACLAEFSMKTTNAPKVIRQVQPIGDYDEYQPPNTTPKPKFPKQIEKNQAYHFHIVGANCNDHCYFNYINYMLLHSVYKEKIRASV